MEITFNLDLNHFQGYLKFEAVKQPKQIETYLGKYIHSNIGTNSLKIKEFIDKYLEYELARVYKSDTKKKNYGVCFEILLPDFISEAQVKSIASRFARQIIQEEKGIKYFAGLHTTRKAVRYLKIWFCDREVITSQKSIYQRNVYVNKTTRIFCDPLDENAELIHHKGEVKLDAEGNEIIIKNSFKTRKTRRFKYCDNDFRSFINNFKELFSQCIRKVKEKVSSAYCVVGKTIRRLNLRGSKTRYHRRIIIANNQLIQLIQNELNLLYQDALRPTTWRDISRGADKDEVIIDEFRSGKIDDLFGKYRKIFRDGEFDSLRIKDYRCDEVESNLKKLKEAFYQDLTNLNALFIG